LKNFLKDYQNLAMSSWIKR